MMWFIKYGDKDELNNYVLIEIQIYRLKWIILLSKYDYDNIYQEIK